MTSEAVFPRAHLQPVPLAAVALALLLHLGTGTALWWIAPDKPPGVEDEPIMVTFDTLQQSKLAGSPTGSVATSAPATPQPASAASPRQQAMAAPEPEPQSESKPEAAPSLPIFEFSIPPAPQAPPPPTSRDFRMPLRPSPPKIVQRLPVLPPRPSAPPRPLAELSASMPSPVPAPNAGDLAAGRGPRNDYLSRVFRHLEPYRYELAGTSHPHGRVQTRVTLARDGRVLDVVVAGSSGSPALDAIEVAAIRKGSPFPPLPAAMPGDSVILWLPMNY